MIIRDILNKNKSGTAIGLPSFCSSNMFVIDAALDYALQKDVPVVIEATSNQINQFGGYTGLLPKDFSKKVRSISSAKGIEDSKLILGGDHLGPNPWRHLSADKAMENAQVMV
ncbi:MAG: class II D-tagatose-bisphosphate aldolase, non-catalytic subunit, partial [Emcibacteraceae bacterium]